LLKEAKLPTELLALLKTLKNEQYATQQLFLRVRPQFYDSLKKQIDIILIFCVRSLNSLNH